MLCPLCNTKTIEVPIKRPVQVGKTWKTVWDKEQTCKNCGWAESSGLPDDESDCSSD